MKQYDQASLEAMVRVGQQHLTTMEQTEWQAEIVPKLVAAFSLYVGARYAKGLLLLELLLPDLETLTPEMRVQIDQRLDQLEQKLDQIEQQTVEKILNLI